MRNPTIVLATLLRTWLARNRPMLESSDQPSHTNLSGDGCISIAASKKGFGRLSPLVWILLLAFLIRVFLALRFPNIHKADEIFQTLEQAHRLVFGYGFIPWEFEAGIRSWLFPGVLAVVMKLTAWLGAGSTGYLTGTSIFLCFTSLSLVLTAYLWGYRHGGLAAAILTSGVCTIWFEFLHFAPKALNEVIGAHLLLPALYLAEHPSNLKPPVRWTLVGVLFGLILGLRIHFLPAITFATVYTCGLSFKSKWLPLVLGVLVGLGIFGAIDALTWSYPFQSIFLNIWINVAEGRSRDFGVSPWYAYIGVLKAVWTLPVGAILFALAAIGARHQRLLAWVSIIIVFTHSFIAHKEYRFIYPAIAILLVLASLGAFDVIQLIRTRWQWASKKMLATSLSLMLFTVASLSLASQYSSDKTLSYLGGQAPVNHWVRYADTLLAMKHLSTDQTLCGLGVAGIPWFHSGGYAHLHQDVPILFEDASSVLSVEQAKFNYLLSVEPIASFDEQYALSQCWGNTCLYRRPGPCQ